MSSQNPEMSMNAHFGVRVTVVAARGPENEQSCSGLGLGGMVMLARECRNPEIEQNVLAFGVGRLVGLVNDM